MGVMAKAHDRECVPFFSQTPTAQSHEFAVILCRLARLPAPPSSHLPTTQREGTPTVLKRSSRVPSKHAGDPSRVKEGARASTPATTSADTPSLPQLISPDSHLAWYRQNRALSPLSSSSSSSSFSPQPSSYTPAAFMHPCCSHLLRSSPHDRAQHGLPSKKKQKHPVRFR